MGLADRIVVRPLPDDAVGSLRGKYRGATSLRLLRSKLCCRAVPGASLTVGEVVDRLARLGNVDEDPPYWIWHSLVSRTPGRSKRRWRWRRGCAGAWTGSGDK